MRSRRENNNSVQENTVLEQIWSEFGPKLCDHICNRTGQQDECHDILQEVFIKMFRNIDKIQKADNILSYILTIANNSIIDHYRANRMEALPEPVKSKMVDPGLPAESASTRLAQTFLVEAILSLPPIYRQALIRTELEGTSQKQLATDLNMSYSGVKSRVQRAKDMLRKSILNCCDYKFDKYCNVISCCGSDCC